MQKFHLNFTLRIVKVLLFVSVVLISSLAVGRENAVCTDFNLIAAQSVDSRIATQHDPAVNKLLYSVQNHAQGLYTRSANCWAADLDLTCASPWNSNSDGVNKRAGTLITPRHVLMAAHFPLSTGDRIRFVTKDNVTIERTIIANLVNSGASYKRDLQMALLDSDVPGSISVCQFLPSNYATYLSNDGAGLPALYLDQEEKALVADVWGTKYYFAGSDDYRYYLQVPTLPYRLAMNETIIGGDSGNPVFLILNGKPVLLGMFTFGYAGSGSSLTNISNLPNGGTGLDRNLNDLILATDALAELNTGYKISFFDFNPVATKVDDLVPELDIVSAVGRNLSVKQRSNTEMEISVFDLCGREIMKQSASSSHFT